MARLGEVSLDQQVELTSVHHDLFPAYIAHRIRRVGCEPERQPRLVLPSVAHGETRLQISVGVGGVRRRKVEHR